MDVKILILGKTGMLGSLVYQYLSEASPYTVHGTIRNKHAVNRKALHYFDAQRFNNNPKPFAYIRTFDYIINCIGIIKPHCQDTDPTGVINAIEVNALFPHRLANYCKSSHTKILQIATDCVYSGKRGHYTEDAPHDGLDVYGKTKSLGEVRAKNILHIRCSIIGPERNSSYSLLEWFLHQQQGATLKGYSHHKWNGVTTLQFAKLCQKIIQTNAFNRLRKTSHIYHFVPNTTVTKHELLGLFKGIFHKKIMIREISDPKNTVDRTLSTTYPSFTSLYGHGTIAKALKELKLYMQTYPKNAL